MQCLFPEQHLDIKLQKSWAVLLFICSHWKKIVFSLTGARSYQLKEERRGSGLSFPNSKHLTLTLGNLRLPSSWPQRESLRSSNRKTTATPKLKGPFQSSHFKCIVTSEPEIPPVPNSAVPNLIPNRTSWIIQLIHSPIQRAINISDLNATNKFLRILIILKPPSGDSRVYPLNCQYCKKIQSPSSRYF